MWHINCMSTFRIKGYSGLSRTIPLQKWGWGSVYYILGFARGTGRYPWLAHPATWARQLQEYAWKGSGHSGQRKVQLAQDRHIHVGFLLWLFFKSFGASIHTGPENRMCQFGTQMCTFRIPEPFILNVEIRPRKGLECWDSTPKRTRMLRFDPKKASNVEIQNTSTHTFECVEKVKKNHIRFEWIPTWDW